MNLIVAVDNNWAIGKDNKLLMNLPGDMKFFRTKTSGSVVIMGRKTLESFPGGEPLKNRINIVITKNDSYEKEGVIVAHSIDEAVSIAKTYDKEIFVIGGASIYAQALSLCDYAYVTKIYKSFEEPDSFFPNLNNNKNWEMIEEGESNEYEGTIYKFCKYKNNH
jgi:dihydrofolate reductase